MNPLTLLCLLSSILMLPNVFSLTTTHITNISSTRLTNRVQNFCSNYTTSAGQIIYAIFLIIVIIISILGNILVCFTILTYQNLRENPTNLFLVSLAISDMMFAVFVLPFHIDMILHDRRFCFSTPTCEMFIIMDLISVPASITTLLVIAIDRFICIMTPFTYHKLMSRKRALVLIGLVWIYSVIWAGLSTFAWHGDRQPSITVLSPPRCVNGNHYFYLTAFFVLYLIPLGIMGFTYLTILSVAKGQFRAIRATSVLSIGKASDLNGQPDRCKEAKKSQTKRELRATRTVVMVYGAFLICWLPSCLINTIHAFDNQLFIKLRINNPNAFLFVSYTFTEILPFLSVAINPFIYNFSSRQFRYGFKVVMLRLFGKHDQLDKLRSRVYESGTSTRASRASISMNSYSH